ncbi:MAG: 3-deoxy-D-manno-octulosonic acid transferase [Oceanospirillaceae bacterium]|nr:3-deoxy-D-manno-octulosonic acid transferase [Oceanospirillaceae bacterium]
MARILYPLLFTLLLPVFVARLWWRGRKNPGYRRRIGERFGRLPHAPRPNGLWVHAVSVGETLAAAPFVKAFQQQYPDVSVIMTTTTPTGSEQVRRLFGNSVFHMYMPYDLPLFLNRFLRTLKPGLLVVMETELWPNLLAACQARHIPVVLANARMSEKSARGYEKFSALTRPMLQRLAMVAVQNPVDGERFVQLGLPADRMEVTGSVKYDVTVPAGIHDKGRALRAEWGGQRTVLALASGHGGEDELLLDLYPRLQEAVPDLLLLLIPRHPERFEAVTNAVRSRGLRVQRRSSGSASEQTQVYVADTMGEMLQLLAAADLVLVGDSLIAHGGHNPIEPAALGKATLIGPHHMNFAVIVDNLQNAGALALVSDQADELLEQLQNYLSDADLRSRMGAAGQAAVDANRGAVKRLTELCSAHLKL